MRKENGKGIEISSLGCSVIHGVKTVSGERRLSRLVDNRGSAIRDKSGWSVKLTTHVHLRSTLKIREDKTSPCSFVSIVRSLMTHADKFSFVTNRVKKTG